MRNIICGIDECSKGSLYFSMYIACFIKDVTYTIQTKGIRDSKKLSNKQIFEKYKSIKREVKNNKNQLDFIYYKISPEEIDNKNIIDLEIDYIIKILNYIENKFPNDKVIIYIDKFSNKLDHIIPKENISIISEYKADDKYLEVSTASIIAKYNREKDLNILRSELNIDFGSGYPSDKKTINCFEQLKLIEKEKNIYIIRKKWKIKRI